jgi:hypothetical protein
MNKKPSCPKCGKTEFVCEPIPMPNNDYWNPVICASCGTIVGQLPSNDEREAFERSNKLLTFEEDLGFIRSFLLECEKHILK